jgi:hypothetical protein
MELVCVHYPPKTDEQKRSWKFWEPHMALEAAFVIDWTERPLHEKRAALRRQLEGARARLAVAKRPADIAFLARQVAAIASAPAFRLSGAA